MPDTLEASAKLTARPSTGIILAFDFGRRRIGIATGNLLTHTSTALTTLHVRDDRLPWPDIDRIVADFEPNPMVVGMPVAPLERDGKLSPRPGLRHDVEAFVATLTARYARRIETVDESLTSKAAEAEIRETRRRGMRRRGKDYIDQRAACLIAEQWMAGQGTHRDFT